MIDKPDNLIVDLGDRKYFYIIPNLVDDLGLSPFAFRLYCHFKRVAGENGRCWQSTRNLADRCRMSVGAVVNAKKELLEQGFIDIEVTKNPKGGIDFHQIKIADIWQRNLEHAQEQVHSMNLTSSPGELVLIQKPYTSSPGELTSSPGELKKNPLKKNPKKRTDAEKTSASPTLFPIAQALSEVTGMALEKNRGRLFKEAKAFNPGEDDQILKDYSPGGTWYQNDWRGKKGSRPTPGQIRETWGGLSEPQPTNGRAKVKYTGAHGEVLEL
ncbi:MAG: helix-turn-helix domain-containing protein [Planctomycetes bacterium]|nr:helix-turn-helix domain-containing protein [Planctomycetota bacterium]